MRYEIFGIRPEQGQWRWSEERANVAKRNYEEFCANYKRQYSLDDYIGQIRQEEGGDIDFVRLGPEKTVQYYVPPRNYRIVSDVWLDLRSAGRFTDFLHEKHEELIRRMIRWTTGHDDIILDSFAGSGSTAHAALSLNKEDGGNRRFILVECEDYADTLTAERVRRVINGVPDARIQALREGTGGSFTYCTLGAPIEIEGMLTGDSLPAFPSLAAYLLHAASGVSAGEDELQRQDEDGLFYSSDMLDYYLLYRPDLEYLRSDVAVLNEERARRISAASRERGKQAIVFGAGKYIGQRELTDWGITFVQLPYQMHRTE